MALVPRHVQPLPEPDCWPGTRPRWARRARTARRTGRLTTTPQFDQLVSHGLAAAQPEHGRPRLRNRPTRSCGTRWCRCPSTPEPSGAGLEPHDRRGDADARGDEPALVRAAVGGAPAGVDQQHHAVAARVSSSFATGLGDARARAGRIRRSALRSPDADFSRSPVGVAE